MERQPRAATSTGTDVALAALLGATGLGTVLWVGAAASAMFSGHRVPPLQLIAGFAAFAHAGHPSGAWAVPVGPAPLYWALTSFALAAAAMASYGLWRLWRSVGTPAKPSDPLRAEGLATRGEVRSAAGAKVLLARAGALRPSLEHPRPSDVGYRLGTSRSVECWASVEDSMLVLGPPRSGKGASVVVPTLLDAPGAVVTTSTRPDNLAVTLAARSHRCPVMVFDPQRLAQGSALAVLRWSLTRGCEDPQIAMIRAEALVADTGRSGWTTPASGAPRRCR